jgi:hypothetical protein
MAMKAALPCAAALVAALLAPTAVAQTVPPAPASPQAEAPGSPAPPPAPTPPANSERPAAAPTKKAAIKPAQKVVDKEAENKSMVLPLPPAEATSAQSECAWVGKRVVSLLVRDDVDTATDFTRFYAMFRCPEAHIGATLACVVSDPAAAREGTALTEHVDLCWANPSTRLLPQKPPNPDKPAPNAGR